MLNCTFTDPHIHHRACGCLSQGLSRRTVFRLGLSVAAAGVVAASGRSQAASGHYEAMLLNCIDPRFVTGKVNFMSERSLREKYSHFVIAGGPIGVVSPKFSGWHQTFWDNLAVSIQLHNITKVIGFTHRDCGAAKIAFGDAAVANPASETKSHSEALVEFRAQVAQKQPKMQVFTGIMAPNGSVDMINDRGEVIPGPAKI